MSTKMSVYDNTFIYKIKYLRFERKWTEIGMGGEGGGDTLLTVLGH